MDFYTQFIKIHPAKSIETNGIKREYITGGKGEIGFLIFPGSGQDALSCYDLIDAYEKRYKVIAVNYDRIYSLEDFYTYVNGILAKENVTSVVLYGLSLGGFLAQHYVRKYPHIIQSLIISHSGSTKSKTIQNKVAKPGKLIYKFVPIIPQFVLNFFFKPIAGRVQAGQSDIIGLYKKYSTEDNLDRRSVFSKNTSFSLIDKNYLKTVYSLGIEMEKAENNFTVNDLKDWKGRILIIRTDNDPLAQDDGMFKIYYPEAKVVSFQETGHLTPFIQFEKMVEKINEFVSWMS